MVTPNPSSSLLDLEHHLRVPEDLAFHLKAHAAHQRGWTGKGIKIAVIDSGFWRHPFYESRGYRINRIPTIHEPDPETDLYGHGTAQLASILSIAPEAELIAIKCLSPDPCSALETALSYSPHIMNCAWGFDIDQEHSSGRLPEEYWRLEKLIRQTSELGITWVAAAGNGQYPFPANMPEVLSAGGAYLNPQGEFEISNLASRFESQIYPGRTVPDLCGISGNLPHGRLLLVPVPPSSRLAKRKNWKSPFRGWALFSGTSAATGMISGAAAILQQILPQASPLLIKQVLIETARTLPNTDCRVLDLDAASNAAEKLASPLIPG